MIGKVIAIIGIITGAQKSNNSRKTPEVGLHRTNLVGAEFLSMANCAEPAWCARFSQTQTCSERVAGREFDGANRLRRGWIVVRPARGPISSTRASGIDFGGGQFESDWGCDESRASVLFSDSRCEPDSCLLIALTTDVRLLLNSSALPASCALAIAPMTGLYLAAAGVAGALAAFSLFAVAVVGSMAALPGFFRMDKRWNATGPWYLMGLVRRHFRLAGRYKIADDGVRNVLRRFWPIDWCP